MSRLQLSESEFQATSDKAGQAMDQGDYTEAAASLSQLLQTLQLHKYTNETIASAPATTVEHSMEETTRATPRSSSPAVQQKLLLSLAECHTNLGDPLKVGHAALIGLSHLRSVSGQQSANTEGQLDHQAHALVSTI